MIAPATRLDFVLPDFTRIAWTSDEARRTWEPWLDRIGRAWRRIERESVVAKLRRCCLVRVTAEELVHEASGFAARGVTWLPIAIEADVAFSYSSTSAPARPGVPTRFVVVIGEPAATSAFAAAYKGSDHETIGELLGYPACCRAFFQRVWCDERSVDTTWAMASGAGSGDVREVAPATPANNILLRWAGVRAVPHLPCSFDCEATAAFGARLADLGRALGFADEIDRLAEMLAWPIEWSALHGIAEVKTPVFRISTRTDATTGRLVVRIRGDVRPIAAATGLRFPYRAPSHVPSIASAGFRRGLTNAARASGLVKLEGRPAWHHQDNGFTTYAAMTRAHRPLVDAGRAILGGASVGDVMDLGCGNGLLAAALASDTRAAPYGIDVDAARIAHAGALHPRFAANFVVGNLFDPDGWPRRTWALVVLMGGRLLEVDRPIAERTLATLRATGAPILVYSYDRPIASIAKQFGFAVRALDDRAVALLA